MKQVFIAGTGITNFGELWDRDLRSLAIEASLEAIKNSGRELSDIDAVFVANMASGSFSGQEHLNSLLSSELGLDCPSYRLEGACASGSMAINAAYLGILSEKYNNVLVIGAEKMTDVSVAEVTKGLSGAADEEWEAFYGATFPSLYAMIARAYMEKYNKSRKDLALVSVKNHANGALNPKAQFQKEISLEAVLAASPVAEPLGLLDCSPVSDGAAAIILTNSEIKNGVKIAASNIATGSIALHDRQDILIIDAAVRAAKQSYSELGISPKDVDIAEVHDCFSIAELIAYEDLGFAERGKAVNLLRSGKVMRDGQLPINTSGGLKACGHPVGATGIKQAIEITLQLLNEAGKRQVAKKLKYGLTHNVGGSGGTCVVNIFEKTGNV